MELLIVVTDATLVLAHTDGKQGAAGTYKHTFGSAPLLDYLDRGAAPGEPLAAWHLRERQVGFSLGMQADAHVRQAIFAQPEHVWTPAAEPDGQLRSGAEVCELTGWVDLGRWPDGTRVICRKGDAHPAANSARQTTVRRYRRSSGTPSTGTTTAL